jgi:cytochrome c553
MTIQRLLPLIGLIMAVGIVSTSRAAGDAAAGKQKSQLCEYINKELHDFQSGARNNAQMKAMAGPLSGQDIENLAAYFSSQETKIGTAAKDSVKKGQSLYRAGDAQTGVPACMACHSPTGAGNPAAAYPMLHGQHAQYTVTQLNAFKSGARSNDPNAIMRTIAGRMTAGQIKAVAQYIQGLH